MNPIPSPYFLKIVALCACMAVINGCATLSFDESMYAAKQQIIAADNILTNAILRGRITKSQARDYAAKIDKARDDWNALFAIRTTLSASDRQAQLFAIEQILIKLEGKLDGQDQHSFRYHYLGERNNPRLVSR